MFGKRFTLYCDENKKYFSHYSLKNICTSKEIEDTRKFSTIFQAKRFLKTLNNDSKIQFRIRKIQKILI